MRLTWASLFDKALFHDTWDNMKQIRLIIIMFYPTSWCAELSAESLEIYIQWDPENCGMKRGLFGSNYE